ncbi:MAG: hypothetical protein LBR26_17115 [Prevotella sp.]|nr:hypothetical protein [Prevotella sp.]
MCRYYCFPVGIHRQTGVKPLRGLGFVRGAFFYCYGCSTGKNAGFAETWRAMATTNFRPAS